MRRKVRGLICRVELLPAYTWCTSKLSAQRFEDIVSEVDAVLDSIGISAQMSSVNGAGRLLEFRGGFLLSGLVILPEPSNLLPFAELEILN